MSRAHRALGGVNAVLLGATISLGASSCADKSGGDDGDLARDIEIQEVEFNQAVRVVIGEGHKAVDHAEKVLVPNRDTLIRVHYEVGSDWKEREIEARLYLSYPDGRRDVQTQVRTVDGDSARNSLDRTFFFSLVGEKEEAVPGMKYQVKLFEVEPEKASGSRKDVVTPLSEPAEIEFRQEGLGMRIVFVPIHYTLDGETLEPDVSDENMEHIVDTVFEQNPLEEIEWELRPPIEEDRELTNLATMLSVMQRVRDADNAPPDVYYHGLIDVGSLTLNRVLGIANIAGPEKDDATRRVAVTVVHDDIETAALTVSHEIGHNQGFGHVACPGAEAQGEDDDYPHEDGEIGVWGFAIRSLKLHSPTVSRDYMSYCGPAWVSDWTWERAYERIQTLSSWESEGTPSPSLATPTLVGLIYGDGTADEWWTARGHRKPDDTELRSQSQFRVEYIGQGRVLGSVSATVTPLSDDVGSWVTAPLLSPGELGLGPDAVIDELVYVEPAGRTKLDTSLLPQTQYRPL